MSELAIYPRLKDKVVLITGASAGIGEASAIQFAACGAKLILVARRLEKLNAIADKLKTTYNVAVHTAKIDVTDQKGISEFFASLPEEFKGIDVLVNNAGAAFGTNKVYETPADDAAKMLAINVEGVLTFLRHVVPIMIDRKTGTIVNVSSIAGLQTYLGGGVYAATKHAVEAITNTLRKEIKEHPIRVVSINPGLVETEFSVIRFGGDKNAAKNPYKGIDPLVGEDIADSIAYACSRKPHFQVAQMILFPTHQAAVDVVYRQPQ
jgi:NADP-dependent 3-hydroxy acid dehydrogenase YdfG